MEPIDENLSNDGKIIISIMNKRFSEIQKEFSQLLICKNEEIDRLKTLVHNLAQKVDKLEDSMDDEDAYVRRDTIILSGSAVPEVQNGEICSNVVCDLVKDKLHLQVRDGDISTAHRLGKKPTTQGPDKRSIVAKLCRRDLKNEILHAKKSQVSTRQSTLYVNESLTPRRSTIMYTLRRMKRAHPNIVAGCSSYDGRVYVYTKPTATQSSAQAVDPSSPGDSNPRRKNVRHLVNTHKSLVEFCRTFIKKPLDNFLESWNH